MPAIVDRQENVWREEDDARTLAYAEAIKTDKNRMKGAKRGAKRLKAQTEKRAKEAVREAATMKKLAGTTNKKSTKKTKKKK